MAVLRSTNRLDGPRLCFIGNPDSIHVRRWSMHFAKRGFDVHILSFYSAVGEAPAGVTLDFVRQRTRPPGDSPARTATRHLPGVGRLMTAARLMNAGFGKAIRELEPDLVNAHYVSDYGFLAALAGRHPLVVSAWGSDILVDPRKSLITRGIVRWVLPQADLITYNSDLMAATARRLGAKPERLLEVFMGVDDDFMTVAATAPPPAQRSPIIVSLRSLERPLYNVEVIVRAMPEVARKVPGARLLVGNDGALRGDLEKLAATLGVQGSVDFIGVVRDRTKLAELLGRAAVYVSVPSSDGSSVTLLEALASGAYPVVSDLPANRQWIDESGGGVVPVGGVSELADAIVRGLTDTDRRARAATRNIELVRQRGLWERNMAKVESAYRDLIAAPSAGGGATAR
jgi:glycosyltransferase involved in cell wall biosynthesis